MKTHVAAQGMTRVLSPMWSRTCSEVGYGVFCYTKFLPALWDMGWWHRNRWQWWGRRAKTSCEVIRK